MTAGPPDRAMGDRWRGGNRTTPLQSQGRASRAEHRSRWPGALSQLRRSPSPSAIGFTAPNKAPPARPSPRRRQTCAHSLTRRAGAGRGRAAGAAGPCETCVRKRRSVGAVTDWDTWVRVEVHSVAKVALAGQGFDGAEAAAVLEGIANRPGAPPCPRPTRSTGCWGGRTRLGGSPRRRSSPAAS